MRISITLVVVVTSFVLSPFAFSDGFLVRKIVAFKQKEPVQSVQQAAILWCKGKEILHLRSNYQGPKAEFAWVIPVPTQPTVERSSWEVFRTAEEETRPQVMMLIEEYHGRGGCGCTRGVGVTSSGRQQATGVTVLQSLEIRELHVDILVATGATGLLEWLHTNGYTVPASSQPILQEYINKNFYFVAVKVQKNDLPDNRAPGSESVDTGLTPLAITFQTNSPFFPLKISSISSAPENEILLILATPQPMKSNEYTLVNLNYNDVKKLVQTISVPYKQENLDLGPAVRAAQAVSLERSLVLEWRTEIIPGNKVARVIQSQPSPLTMYDKLWLHRMHAFLKPDGMVDITFVPDNNEMPVISLFQFSQESLLKSSCVPIGLVIVIMSMLGLSWRTRHSSKLRMFGTFLILLACSCLL